MAKNDSKKLNIFVSGHLLVPFGRPKWDISRIKISGVSTGGTYFTSDTPCAYINRTSNSPLRIRDLSNCIPGFNLEAAGASIDGGSDDSANAVMRHVQETLLRSCDMDTDFEKRFLELYFKWLKETTSPRFPKSKEDLKRLPRPINTPWWQLESLLPLPQAHLYVRDPLSKGFSVQPENMFKVDFAFWTGKCFIAVEIDGSSHVGSERHVTKDRMLQRAGVHVIHILNKELLEHGTETIKKLLPNEISRFWSDFEGKPLDLSDLDDFPF